MQGLAELVQRLERPADPLLQGSHVVVAHLDDCRVAFAVEGPELELQVPVRHLSPLGLAVPNLPLRLADGSLFLPDHRLLSSPDLVQLGLERGGGLEIIVRLVDPKGL